MSWDHVYRYVQRIPRGRVLTYGSLAKALRLPGGARTAGRAMAATPSGKGIPWHRVLGERGKILIREPYSSLQRNFSKARASRLLNLASTSNVTSGNRLENRGEIQSAPQAYFKVRPQTVAAGALRGSRPSAVCYTLF